MEHGSIWFFKKKSVIAKKTTDKNDIEIYLNDVKLSLIKGDVPDLAFIKRHTYKLQQQVKNFQNEEVHQSLGIIRDVIFKYGNKSLLDLDSEKRDWLISAGINPIKWAQDLWMVKDDEKLVNNRKYCNPSTQWEFIPMSFYAIASKISEFSDSKVNMEIAIENYKISLRINHDYHQSYMRLGDCYHTLENYNKAISYYKTALSIKDCYADWCYLGIGICLAKSGNKNVGELFIKESKKICNETFTAYLLFGYNSWDTLFKELLYDH